jgi:pimeloyl-ACP methyl ester carboxylesterase
MRFLATFFGLALLLGIMADAFGDSSRIAIKEEMFVPVGGIEQWITITGDDRDNAVLLSLHGGPGDALSPYSGALFAGQEKDFVVVQWDQRGAGRTFGKSGPSVASTMTMDRMVSDGNEVAEYLIHHLRKNKIVLMGGSWGSILGVEMVQARPDLYSAYLSLAQVVNWQEGAAKSYSRVLELARSAGDQDTVSALTAVGPPPWSSLPMWAKFRKVERRYQAMVATAKPASLVLDPAYASPTERQTWAQADDLSFVQFVGMKMDGPLTQVDLQDRIDFAVPVFLVHGAEDLTAPPDLVNAYFDHIRAPRKRLYMVSGAGHEPSESVMLKAFEVLRTEVRPLTH